ncbi:MAG: DUF1638 domain-containing protein [Candidatus Pelethousia sp.]|nr:DUF1638 domain-containing protein [Candidatus Pelethousia sp.]
MTSNNCAIIACEMLEDELAYVMRIHGCDMPITWLDRGLHDTPKRLQAQLEAAIKKYAAYPTVLLAITLCGNALEGVGSATSRLIIPRFHDCIQMQLACERNAYSLYWTRGWLLGDQSFEAEYLRACKKYGEEKAMLVYRLMLKNYTSITMVDTGAYNIEESMDIPRAFAERFDLRLSTCKGSMRVLDKLVSGQWDEEFYTLEPGETCSLTHFLSDT